MDKGTFGGLLLAMVGIVGGLVLEGGNVGQVIQPTAALIVFGGTLGAVMVQFPLEVTLTAFRRLGNVFFQPDSIFPAIRAVTFSCLLRRAVWERGVGAARAFAVALSDPAQIAASSDGAPGSNGNLLNLVDLRDQNIVNGQRPDEFYSNLISRLGTKLPAPLSNWRRKAWSCGN